MAPTTDSRGVGRVVEETTHFYRKLCEQFLGLLEDEEQRLLQWGLTEGSFSRQEIEKHANEVLERFDPKFHFADAGELIAVATQFGILFRISDLDDNYRTRTAEAIRLFASLRQLFNKHMRDGSWVAAPKLVGDYRYVRRQRQFPRRDVELQKVVSNLESQLNFEGTDSVLPYFMTIFPELAGRKWKFSGFQERTFIELFENSMRAESVGSIVCAGTGSGKTIAYYAPVIAWIANEIANGESRGVRSISVYPRNELLKDQLVEIYGLVSNLNDLMMNNPLRLGAYFGQTPRSAESLDNFDYAKQIGWNRIQQGLACPFFRCVTDGCNGDMVWLDSDRNAKPSRHILVCEDCEEIVDSNLVLTRQEMFKNAPDIVLTSTEMLSQNMANTSAQHLFGIGPKTKCRPKYFLLDEAHTHSGTTGAQVAYLLRRWRHLVRSPVIFTGLSATLANAEEFFGELIGLPTANVSRITPLSSELVGQGAEYMLAIRANPASKRSTLSVSIQAAMLLGRILDRRSGRISEGIFGSRSFLFTDDLDVTNRLYWDFLSAEGRNSFGAFDDRKNGGLAMLRSPEHFPDRGDSRFADGQRWDLCRQLGHGLDERDRLQIGRTTSQDVGVLRTADAIVATASLEVGFNDPEVGAVLQHKAPRDNAQFIQRKGRAGRTQIMRPWTVVVLSDYGRDRIAYQSYERMFDPELPAKNLPIKNIAVLRMQSVFALIDWISANLPSGIEGSVYRDLSSPWHEIDPKYGRIREGVRNRQKLELELIESLLEVERDFQKFKAFLCSSLGGVDDDVIQEILWEPPRGLMTEVIPTIGRRLRHGWMALGESGAELVSRKSPLPEFAPKTLFSDLALPELSLALEDFDGAESMAIASGLREFTPGRVSRRFGVRHAGIRHWIPIDLDETSPNITYDIDEHYFGLLPLGNCSTRDGGNEASVRVFRPTQCRPAIPPRAVRDSSNSFFRWHTNILVPQESENKLGVFAEKGVAQFVEDFELYMHRLSNPVQIVRFATGFDASVDLDNGETKRISGSFINKRIDETEYCALGFDLDVDAIRIKVSIPSMDIMIDTENGNELVRSLRVNRFSALLQQSTAENSIANSFETDWVSTVYVAMISLKAVTDGTSLSVAANAIADSPDVELFRSVLNVIFMNADPGNGDGLSGDEEGSLQERIIELLLDPEMILAIFAASPTLWQDPSVEWADWVRDKWLSTFGGAFINGVGALCPNVDTSDLLFDIRVDNSFDSNSGGDTVSVWVSEKTVGGGGVIESFVKEYTKSPKAFFRLMDAALQPSDYELLDGQLGQILDRLVATEKNAIQNLFGKCRRAKTYIETERAFGKLRSELRNSGVGFSPALSAAMNSRQFRKGSSLNTDKLLYLIRKLWNDLDRQLGIEVDARMVAFLASQDVSIRAKFEAEFGKGLESNSDYWRFSALYGLVWARGSSVREQNLTVYNPFSLSEKPDRLLMSVVFTAEIGRIDVCEEGWIADYVEQLTRKGEVRLRSADGLQHLKAALVSILLLPIDTGILITYGAIQGVFIVDGLIEALISIPEFER